MSKVEYQQFDYVSQGGVSVFKHTHDLPLHYALADLAEQLDTQRGALFSSSYEYPGRYTRWDMGFVNPPISLSCRGRDFRIEALNDRGQVLLPLFERALSTCDAILQMTLATGLLSGTIQLATRVFAEEERSKQPSVFSVIRAIKDYFYTPDDTNLGLYGAFGYDLVFQFEDIALAQHRPDSARDLVLYFPDEIRIIDHRLQRAIRIEYEFAQGSARTHGLPRTGQAVGQVPVVAGIGGSDHAPGQYAAQVNRAIESFARGDLFEVVPGQTLSESCSVPPSMLFDRLKRRNPCPYGFLINLGGEHLIGASPEMYVRVEGRRVETCPISGTVIRGLTPIEDADRIRELINSSKDESELTMCTDVDRNDKSRICEPGSVKVIGRRQIEMYSRVIHTVDHVEGTLREGYDALDAFLTHMWAVTVTGAPKRAAIEFLEDNELSPRRWYGGAVGYYGFCGTLNTGLTLRTIRLEAGMAEVRVGATLLFDSIPEDEELETRNKAAALMDAILNDGSPLQSPAGPIEASKMVMEARANDLGNLKVLLIDHQDSFVHTLANYFRQTGAQVMTRRATKQHGFDMSFLDTDKPDLIVLSPGPGTPSDFHMATTLDAILSRDIPVFGVCLGLQGIVEYFGGQLGVLDYPMHGKPSRVFVEPSRETVVGDVFRTLPNEVHVARYHSLYAIVAQLPTCLDVTAMSDDGVVMAVQHRTLPISAVQFHPESILSLQDNHGMQMIWNVVNDIASRR